MYESTSLLSTDHELDIYRRKIPTKILNAIYFIPILYLNTYPNIYRISNNHKKCVVL